MLRARALPPAWALKWIWRRSPPRRTSCSASSSALLPAPLGAMMADVRSSCRGLASNREYCTRCMRSTSCMVVLRVQGVGVAIGVAFGIGPAAAQVVLVQAVQPLPADDVHDRRPHHQVERLQVVRLALDQAAHAPAARGGGQRAQRADL